MSKWSDPKSIREDLNRKWESGCILRYLIAPDNLFPLQIPLKKPNRSEINERFAEIAKWIKTLKEQDWKKLGYGYTLNEKEMFHQQSGRNLIPTHAVIHNVEDALLLLKKKREGELFLELSAKIQNEWPGLKEWITKYPLKILRFSDDWIKILAVLHWFYNHQHSKLYLRQLDIPGINTKFIEHHKGIITELLDIILPEKAINRESKIFEKRYGLRMKQTQIRFRFLDKNLFIQGISDIMIPVEQLITYKPTVSRVFIMENEINVLCFPETQGSMAFFGMGYGIDILKDVEWLRKTDIYYWGDIDTHGFAILDRLRSFLPQAKSFLMEEEVLLQNRALWVEENKPTNAQLTRLTIEENKLYVNLKNNFWGKGIRLEQERIPFKQVQNTINGLL